MQIHELPEYSGDPATNDVFPIDTGTHTFKLPFAELGEAIITTVSTTISGVSQTVKAAIEALTTRMTTAETNVSDLTSRVSTVETKTAYSQTTATLGGQSIGIRKQGRVVTVEFGSLTPNPAIAAQAETVYQNVIPSGYRPATGAIFLVMSSASAVGGNMVQVTFTTTGHVGFYNWSTGAIGPTSGWVRGTFTYFSAE